VRASTQQIQQEALSRAVGNQSLTNWPAIIYGFVAKGIPESEIRPRENVFTYHAWRALGRQVRRGEHGVKVTTFVSVQGKDAGVMTTETAEDAGADHDQIVPGSRFRVDPVRRVDIGYQPRVILVRGKHFYSHEPLSALMWGEWQSVPTVSKSILPHCPGPLPR
jgi:hypothetical protein